MIFRGIDQNGDWIFGRGKNSYMTGQTAIEFNLKTRLLSWKGDCFFALQEGIDYDNLLGVGTKLFLDQDIRRVTLQSEGVLKILSFESSIDQLRNYSCSMTISSIYGTFRIGV